MPDPVREIVAKAVLNAPTYDRIKLDDFLMNGFESSDIEKLKAYDMPDALDTLGKMAADAVLTALAQAGFKVLGREATETQIMMGLRKAHHYVPLCPSYAAEVYAAMWDAAAPSARPCDPAAEE